MTPTSKPSGDETPEETSPPEPPDYGDLDEDLEAGRSTEEYEREPRVYDWEAEDAKVSEAPPEEPVGHLSGLVEVGWGGESWELEMAVGALTVVVKGVPDSALPLAVGGAAARALIERREKAA